MGMKDLGGRGSFVVGRYSAMNISSITKIFSHAVGFDVFHFFPPSMFLVSLFKKTPLLLGLITANVSICLQLVMHSYNPIGFIMSTEVFGPFFKAYECLPVICVNIEYHLLHFFNGLSKPYFSRLPGLLCSIWLCCCTCKWVFSVMF